MPACLLEVSLVTQRGEPVGYMSSGPNAVFSYSPALLAVPADDLAQCSYVALSVSDYRALTGASSGGGGDVDVTADLFVGAFLVVCFIGGWIAGAQR